MIARINSSEIFWAMAILHTLGLKTLANYAKHEWRRVRAEESLV